MTVIKRTTYKCDLCKAEFEDNIGNEVMIRYNPLKDKDNAPMMGARFHISGISSVHLCDKCKKFLLEIFLQELEDNQ